jgi:hypothetical protein
VSNRWLQIVCAAVALIAPVAAHAAEPCAMPPELQQRVCDDPDLRKLADEMAAKERAVLAVTARPATWAARAALFRRWTAEEKDYDGKPLGKEELVARFGYRIEALDQELGSARSIRPAASAAVALGDKCLSGWLHLGCRVVASGTLREADGTRILYQMISGASEDSGGGMGVMLWDASRPGAPKPIGWSFEGYFMHAPRYNAENKLLWVSGTMTGTAGANADVLYQKQGERWVEIDIESWRDDLDKRLPKGLGTTHGVDYDLVSLSADTELWAPEDANCCATGGWAVLGFRIEGHTLKLDTIQAQIGSRKAEWTNY